MGDASRVVEVRVEILQVVAQVGLVGSLERGLDRQVKEGK